MAAYETTPGGASVLTDIAPTSELYWQGRYHCRQGAPYDPARHGDRAFHPAAVETDDHGETRRMECPVCGTGWTEELPQ